jgi:hypothetical protein
VGCHRRLARSASSSYPLPRHDDLSDSLNTRKQVLLLALPQYAGQQSCYLMETGWISRKPYAKANTKGIGVKQARL